MSTTPLTGGYGVVDIPGWFGWNIRLFTRSPFSHAFIVLDAVNGIILEARPEGARLSNLSEYAGLRTEFSADRVDASVADLHRMAAAYVGIGYGYLDIVLLGLVLTLRWKPRWLLTRVLDQHRMICSQLVAQFGAANGQPGWMCGQPDPQLVTPGMLAARI